MMDEDFFLYGEEVEWCSRLQKQGGIYLYGNLQIIHIMGESIKDATNTNDKSYEIYLTKGIATDRLQSSAYSKTIWHRLVFISIIELYLGRSRIFYLQCFIKFIAIKKSVCRMETGCRIG